MKRIIPTLLALGLATTSLAASAIAVHEYDFNGNLNDSIGSVSLVSGGGSLTSFGSYTFLANQGLTFRGESSLGPDYSIAMRFSLDQIGGWRKVVDFKNRSDDSGLYVLNNSINFYPFSVANAGVSASTSMDLVFTRDGTTKDVTAYFNGAQIFSFNDGSNIADATSGGNSLFRFFMDDFRTGQFEASPGSVEKIVLYQGALSPSQVRTALPDGGTSAGLLGLGLMGIFGLRRTLQKH